MAAITDDADVVLVDIEDRVATITINRPHARNALNREVQRKLPLAIARLEADAEVDVMILTGTDPAFSAGVDLKELGAGGDDAADLVLTVDGADQAAAVVNTLIDRQADTER